MDGSLPACIRILSEAGLNFHLNGLLSGVSTPASPESCVFDQALQRNSERTGGTVQLEEAAGIPGVGIQQEDSISS